MKNFISLLITYSCVFLYFFIGYNNDKVSVKYRQFTFDTIDCIETSAGYYFNNGDDSDIADQLQQIDQAGSYTIDVDYLGNEYNLNINVLYNTPGISLISHYCNDIDDYNSYISIDCDHEYNIDIQYEPIYTYLDQSDSKYYQVNITLDDTYNTYSETYNIVETDTDTLYVDNNYSNSTLQDRINNIISKYGINNNDIAYGYQLVDSDDVISFNSEQYFIAASTYKLALNMLLYDQQNQGLLDADLLIYYPDCYEEGDGTLESEYSYYDVIDIDQLHYQSLHYSNNTASRIMYEYLGGFLQYEQLTSKYSDVDIALDNLENDTSVSYLLDVLSYLYNNEDDYEAMFTILSDTMQNEYGAKYTSLIDVHKYGYYDTYINDAGIMYTSTPFYYVVLTNNSNEEVISEIVNEMVKYTIENE